MPEPSSPSLLARSVLAVSEAYCADRRCAVVGPGLSALPEGLLLAGARSVHHYATDAERRPLALRLDRTLLVRELPASDFDVREGAFDVVVVADLAVLGDVPTWLGRFRRLIGASGVLVAGAPRANALDRAERFSSFSVHELDDLMSVQFAWVDLRGLASFHGLVVAPIGARGSIGDFVIHPLDDGRAAPESLVAIASQRARTQEPSLLLEVEGQRDATSSRAASVLEGRAPSFVQDASNEGDAVARLQREHYADLEKAKVERADLLDTISLREASLRACEAEGDGLRQEVLALTTHLDRALAGAVPAHLARLEALADKDRPRVIETPMALAERERFLDELRAADAARAEADDACLRLEARLHTSETQRKALESALAVRTSDTDDLGSQVAMLLAELKDFEAVAGVEIDCRETKLRALARAQMSAEADTHALARWLQASAVTAHVSAATGPSAIPTSMEDEGVLVRSLLNQRARADLLSLEIQALHARLRRIVDAADDAASSSVDMGASALRLTDVSPASAASSLPKLSGRHSDDG